jgi:hypothetical protein
MSKRRQSPHIYPLSTHVAKRKGEKNIMVVIHIYLQYKKITNKKKSKYYTITK